MAGFIDQPLQHQALPVILALLIAVWREWVDEVAHEEPAKETNSD